MKRIVAVASCLVMLSGCTWVRQQWPWKQVWPMDSQAAPTASTAPASQPAEAVAASAPAVPSQPAQAESASRYDGYQLVRPPEVVEALVLQVNDHTITINDVLHPIREKLMQIPPGVSQDAFRRQAEQFIAEEIRRQTTEAMVLDEANRVLTDEEKKKVEEDLSGVVRDMVASAGGSRTRLDQDYRRQGTTLDEVIEAQRRQMLARRYLNQKFLPQLGASRDEMYRYYVQNKTAEFSSPTRVQMQILCVPYRTFYPPGGQSPSPTELTAAKAQAHARMAEIVEKIRAGEDFGAVAKECGMGYRAEEGGLWDPLEAGSFREGKVEQAAFAQEVGQVSDIIEGETGYFLVKTASCQAGVVESFEDAQAKIEQKLRDKQYDQLSRAYFTELYGRATITSAERFEQHVLDRAVQTYYRPLPAGG